MNKSYKILILLGLLGLSLVVLFLSYEKYYKPDVIGEPVITKSDKTITVSLQDEKKSYILEKDKEIPIISKFLQPFFIIRQNKKISNLRIYFDDSREDILSSKFSNVVIERNQDLKIKFQYTLEPQKHKLVIKYDENNQEIIEEYNFLLILFDDFSQPLSQSRLWGLADSAKPYNNWEIKEGRLVAHPLPSDASPDAISSLFFVKRFQGDFFVQFDLIPKTNTIAFLPYLLQRRLNFVFGSNGNKDVIILDKPETRASFTFEALRIYNIRLIRSENIYKVFVTTNRDFSDNDLLITYEDKEQLKVSFDAFGFTIWQNSGGVEIDNFYTANEDVSKILNSYGQKEQEESN